MYTNSPLNFGQPAMGYGAMGGGFSMSGGFSAMSGFGGMGGFDGMGGMGAMSGMSSMGGMDMGLMGMQQQCMAMMMSMLSMLFQGAFGGGAAAGGGLPSIPNFGGGVNGGGVNNFLGGGSARAAGGGGKTRKPKRHKSGKSHKSGSSGSTGSTNSASGASATSGNTKAAAWGKKLAETARNHATGSGGLCYKYVAEDLAKYGVSVHGASAYMAADQLAKSNKFREVKMSPSKFKSLPPGAVVVWNRGNGHEHGHISVALGGGKEASDVPRDQITNYGTSARVFIPK